MWPFTRKPQPIWKQISKELIRQERSIDPPFDSFDVFNVYAVRYIDLIGGETKIEEEWELT